MNDMGWYGRIPLFRLIGEIVLPIGNSSPSVGCLCVLQGSHALIRRTVVEL